jgi:anaerobic sulfite reductase subunit A
MQNSGVGLEGLASLYQTLGRALRERPTAQSLRELDNLRALSMPLPGVFPPGVREGCEAVRHAMMQIEDVAYPELVIETWQMDYRRLFGGVPLPHIVPRESAYRGGDGGRLCDAPTYAIRQAYVEAGFVPNGLPALPDDHIATEFAFVAYLYQQAADAMRRDSKDVERWLTRKQLFVQRHLKQWAFTFCDEVITYAQTNFWKGIALLTKGLVEFEDPLSINAG